MRAEGPDLEVRVNVLLVDEAEVWPALVEARRVHGSVIVLDMGSYRGN